MKNVDNMILEIILPLKNNKVKDEYERLLFGGI